VNDGRSALRIIDHVSLPPPLRRAWTACLRRRRLHP
jgi:hypothetical protein